MALSRVRTLDGLFLTQPIGYSEIISDDAILRFLLHLRILNKASNSPILTRSREESVSPHCRSFMYFCE